jgi:hypothetical protein
VALTAQEQTALRAILTREGGVDAVVDQVRALNIADRKAAAETALASSISVTVSNWPALGAYVAQARGDTLVSVLRDITTAAGAQNASKLGPLFVQLYGAAKHHLGQ